MFDLPRLLGKLFFPALFAGPAFDYVDYRRWIETTMFEVPAGTDPSKAPKVRKKRKIPRSGTPAAIKAVTGLAWIFLYLKFSALYSSDFLLGPDYMKYGLLRRIWHLEMFGFTTRLKYYGVWTLTEGACILSGLGYKGIDPQTGRVNWNRLQNVNPWGIESAQNSRAYLENWNMNTNNWLRNYVYLRVTPKGKKPGFRASLATFTTSAFWHGFYPGYYLSFVFAAFIQATAKSQSSSSSSWEIGANCDRLSSLCSPLFHERGWSKAHVIQTILRLHHVHCDTGSLLLHDCTFRSSFPSRLFTCMEPCIFLCYYWCSSFNGCLCLANEKLSNTRTKETTRPSGRRRESLTS